MALSVENKAHIQAIWPCVAANPEKYGGEALYSLFLCDPQTKTYFPDFDCHQITPQVANHGKKVIEALTEAVKHLDNIEGALDKLSDLHAFKLRVDPGNFPLLSHHLLVVIAKHHSKKFDCCTHQALDKFLARIGCCLTSKYR
ncbi:hemoglobin subunit alpha-2-like [Mixophyes fleayi]|uniref:hemoglobin subunit alpha-2-like n=1 Tax=Mixophyes fleayi TaxID=3061075 RepID=UPI003F4DCA28